MMRMRGPLRSMRTILRQYAESDRLTIMVPSMGDSITSGDIQSIECQPGDKVQVGDTILSIETDKVDVPINSDKNGILVEVLHGEGDTVQVGSPLYIIEEDNSVAEAAPEALSTTPSEPPPLTKPATPATPTPTPESSPKPTPTPTPKQLDGEVGSRRETRVKMTRMRQRIAERLKMSQEVNAMLTTFQEVNMSAVMALRNEFKDEFEKKHGVKLGFMGMFAKASCQALENQPVVNAVIDGSEILYRDYVDISVAVASPTGLVVPVIRNVEKMTVANIESEIRNFGLKAKEGKLSLEDMEGGNFTISNGGVFGSMLGTPIINPPQSSILGMHNIVKRPVVDANDNIVVAPVMYLALTYDHRLIDGREAATFLKSIKQYIENPARLVLDL